MEVSKEEILHIAKLANLKIGDEEIAEYIKNLQDILNFANTVNNAQTDGIDTLVGTSEKVNAFRKDEIKVFEDNDLLLSNAPDKKDNMFRIPKVI